MLCSVHNFSIFEFGEPFLCYVLAQISDPLSLSLFTQNINKNTDYILQQYLLFTDWSTSSFILHAFIFFLFSSKLYLSLVHLFLLLSTLLPLFLSICYLLLPFYLSMCHLLLPFYLSMCHLLL